MRERIVAGVDIGVSSTHTMVARWDTAEGHLHVLGEGVAPSEGMRKGDVVDAHAVASQLKKSILQAEKISGVRISSAFFGYGGATLDSFTSRGSIVLSYANGGEITKRDIERVLEASYTSALPLSHKTILHRTPLVFRVDRDVVTHNPLGLSGSRLEVETLFVTAFSPYIEQLVGVAEKAGVAVDDIIASPLAAGRAVLSKRQKEVGVLVFDIGAGTVGAAVFEEGIPISIASFPIGAQTVTHDIAIGLRIGLEEAEAHKHEYKNYKGAQKKRLEEIVSARMSDIFEAGARHLKKIGRDGLLPAGVVLAGGGAKLADATLFGKEAFRLPVSVGNRACDSGVKDPFDPASACVMGLCLFAFDTYNNPHSLFSSIEPQNISFLWRWIKAFLP